MKKVRFYIFIAVLTYHAAIQADTDSDHHTDHPHSISAWQLDSSLVYQSGNQPVLSGFIPGRQHQTRRGLSLSHMDLSRSQILDSPDEQTRRARINLGFHSGDSGSVNISEAWIQNTWWNEQVQLKTGQLLPHIGFLNHQHSHHMLFQHSPLINQVYWGGQLSEAGAEVTHAPVSDNLSFVQRINILGGKHLNNASALSALYQVEITRQVDKLSWSLLFNAYSAYPEKRGMNLFKINSFTHSHNNGFAEFFKGCIYHAGIGFSINHTVSYGYLLWQLEYAQRQESGELFNSNNGSSLLADIELKSYGIYQQLVWKNSSKTIESGIRYDYLYSQVHIENSINNQLDNSLLNNQGQKPQLLTYALSWQLHQYLKLSIQHSYGIKWSAARRITGLYLHHSVSF